ncbi:MAG TPA: hypothetical protein VMT71_08145 [Syntrophorhabdales bacterium]|nr:hypothetical protein [Syntrophorhabdales bacterium]
MQSIHCPVAEAQDTHTGLCIGCALLHHDFREILGRSPEEDDSYPSEMALPEAWIDGRRCRLVPETTAHEAFCKECTTRAPGLYVPV